MSRQAGSQPNRRVFRPGSPARSMPAESLSPAKAGGCTLSIALAVGLALLTLAGRCASAPGHGSTPSAELWAARGLPQGGFGVDVRWLHAFCTGPQTDGESNYCLDFEGRPGIGSLAQNRWPAPQPYPTHPRTWSSGRLRTNPALCALPTRKPSACGWGGAAIFLRATWPDCLGRTLPAASTILSSRPVIWRAAATRWSFVNIFPAPPTSSTAPVAKRPISLCCIRPYCSPRPKCSHSTKQESPVRTSAPDISWRQS